jgi:hypothetical protein
VAIYALSRLAKNYFDEQRGLNEADLTKKILDQVDGLVQKGWSNEKALAAVLAVSKDVATLRSDSPVLKAAVNLQGECIKNHSKQAVFVMFTHQKVCIKRVRSVKTILDGRGNLGVFNSSRVS